MNNQSLTHYFLFDPEAQALTSHFSDEPLQPRGEYAILCISPLTYKSFAGEHVMNWLAGQILFELTVESGRVRNSLDRYISLEERSQFVVARLTQAYPDAINQISALEDALAKLVWEAWLREPVTDYTVCKKGGAA